MCTIVSHRETQDGYEARVVLQDGRKKVFHWLSKPDDIQDAADEAEVMLKTSEIERLSNIWQRLLVGRMGT